MDGSFEYNPAAGWNLAPEIPAKGKREVCKTRTLWNLIKQKCYNSKHRGFPTHGALGITVCKGWLSFKTFEKYCAQAPEDYVLVRKDKSRDFKPSNCIWIPRKQHCRAKAKSTNKKCKYVGVTEFVQYADISNPYGPMRPVRYQSRIKVNGRQYCLGGHDTQEKAAIARDEFILSKSLTGYPLQILKLEK